MSKLLEIKYNKKQFERIEKLLQDIPHGVEVAAYRAINRAVTAGRTALSKEIRKRYTISAAKVKSTVKLTKAHVGSLQGAVESIGQPVAVMHFKHSPNRDTTGANRKQIRVSVMKGGGGPLLTGFQSSRLADNVFIRPGKGSQIKRAFGPSVPQMAENHGAAAAIQDRMQEVMEQRLDHEVQQVLKGKS